MVVINTLNKLDIQDSSRISSARAGLIHNQRDFPSSFPSNNNNRCRLNELAFRAFLMLEDSKEITLPRIGLDLVAGFLVVNLRLSHLFRLIWGRIVHKSQCKQVRHRAF